MKDIYIYTQDTYIYIYLYFGPNTRVTKLINYYFLYFSRLFAEPDHASKPKLHTMQLRNNITYYF